MDTKTRAEEQALVKVVRKITGAKRNHLFQVGGSQREAEIR